MRTIKALEAVVVSAGDSIEEAVQQLGESYRALDAPIIELSHRLRGWGCRCGR